MSPNFSLKARGECIATLDTTAMKPPTRPKLEPEGWSGAAREAPTVRRVRKLDSLSAATKGPTERILRLVLRCVNGAARRELESRVHIARRT